MIVFGILALVITLVMTFFISRSLSTPIKRMNKLLRTLELDAHVPQKNLLIRSRFDELEELNRTFVEMRERLKESLRRKRIRTVARAAVAPACAAVPDESAFSVQLPVGHQHHVRGRQKRRRRALLQGVVPYPSVQISSTNFSAVPLSEEIRHLSEYVALMKERYGDMLLECQIRIPEAMETYDIPKLIVQPLVENCLKYAIDVQPPWRIRITGKLLTDRWIVTVSGYGPGGFDPAVVQELKRKFSEDPRS